MDDSEEAIVIKDELNSSQRKDPLQHMNVISSLKYCTHALLNNIQNVLLYFQMNVNEASKNRADIKYEDDIELEDYYSDEDSVDHSEIVSIHEVTIFYVNVPLLYIFLFFFPL